MGSKLPKAVFFDMDGTLYDHGALKRRIILELLLHAATSRSGIRDIRIVAAFRKAREDIARQGCGDLERRQYEVPAERLGMPPESVRNVALEWIHRRPLRHLSRVRLPGVRALWAGLRRGDVAVGVYSDYPAEAKLEALGLEADIVAASTDPDIDRFKPDPAGLLVLARRLDLAPAECLMVGDRDDKDGECARRAGVPCRILGKDFPDYPSLASSLGVEI